jgi:intron-binding protein aquarius
LTLVEKLAKGLGVAEDVAYTCETSAHFWLLHVLSRWERFSASVEKLKSSNDTASASGVSAHFPFHAFFADAPNQPLFSGASLDADLEKAKGCFKVRHTYLVSLPCSNYLYIIISSSHLFSSI